MNTNQRNVIRMGCYVLALIAFAFSVEVGIAGIIACIVLIVLGKVVWAGRPMGHLVGMVKDVVEVDNIISGDKKS